MDVASARIGIFSQSLTLTLTRATQIRRDREEQSAPINNTSRGRRPRDRTRCPVLAVRFCEKALFSEEVAGHACPVCRLLRRFAGAPAQRPLWFWAWHDGRRRRPHGNCKYL